MLLMMALFNDSQELTLLVCVWKRYCLQWGTSGLHSWNMSYIHFKSWLFINSQSKRIGEM